MDIYSYIGPDPRNPKRAHAAREQAAADAAGVTVPALRRYRKGIREPDFATMRRIYVWSRGVVTPNDFVQLPQLLAAANASKGKSAGGCPGERGHAPLGTAAGASSKRRRA